MSKPMDHELVIKHLEALITRIKRGDSFHLELGQKIKRDGENFTCGPVTTAITFLPEKK